MSTAAWESPLAPNHDSNGVFNGTIDPSAMDFNASPDFDFAQMSNTPIPQHMQNGGLQRNGSPGGFQQPPYHTQSVVPSKRPHGDTVSNSPRQASRSLTPQQQHFSQPFPGSVNGQPTPNGFQNFNQVNSTTASPSPVMPNQQFNLNGVPQQRVATASPAPFSPAATNTGLQMSPSPSDFSNHGDPGQNGVPNFPQANAYMNGHNVGSPAFNGHSNPMTPQPGQMAPHAVPGSSNMSQEENARRMQAMRNAAMARQQAGMINAGGMQMGPGGPGGPGGPRPGGMPQQMPPLPPQLQQVMQQNMQKLQFDLCNPVMPKENFLPTIANWCQQRNLPFSQTCYVNGRQAHPFNLWALVMQHGGSNTVQGKNMWGQIALKLGFIAPPSQGQDPQQAQMAVAQLREWWKQNFFQFERVKLTEFQQKRSSLMQSLSQRAATMQAQQGGQPRQMQGGMPNMQGPPNPAMLHMRRSSGIEQAQAQMSPQMYPNQPAGFQAGQPQRPGTQGSMTAAIPPQQPIRTPTRPTGKQKPAIIDPVKPEPAKVRSDKWQPGDKFVPEAFSFYTGPHAHLEPHGSFILRDNSLEKVERELEELRPGQPNLYTDNGQAIGVIDIHALSMSLQSGIGAEIRVALDIVANLALDYEDVFKRPFELARCGDLLDALMDCAETQLEYLEEHAAQTSDEVELPTYDELLRKVKDDSMTIQEVHEAGSDEYDLEMAADRLLCILNILQNVSAGDSGLKASGSHPMMLNGRPNPQLSYRQAWLHNASMLSSPAVFETIEKILRAVGTRSRLLRNNQNTLDFYKDAIVFISNVAEVLELQGKGDTSCILHFINTFGPTCDIRTSTPKLEITFKPQEPEQHRYLRYAIDTLAKLLARDEPNRNHIRALLTSEAPYNMFTRTFGLAIAPLPELDLDAHIQSPYQEDIVLKWRQPWVSQGLLAADILVSLLPAGASNVAAAWLHSVDGWPSKILRLVRKFGYGHRQYVTDRELLLDLDLTVRMVERGLNILCSLAERSRDEDVDAGSSDKPAARPPRIVETKMLREAYEAWGEPDERLAMEHRARTRAILRQVDTLIAMEV